jgi:3-hydroxyisobutyrate dehydrogenase
VPAIRCKGAQVFDSGAEAATNADVVITSLPNGDIVKACYAEMLPAAREGTLFIDTSTISVDDARTVNKQAADRGFAQLDAPVSGGVKGATAGTLAFMVGGDEVATERAHPVLEPLAGKIIHCGPSGNGQAAKLCNNMVLAVQQIAIGEAFVLAEKLGLSAQSLFDVITGATGNCWSIHTNCPVPGPVPTSPASNDFKPGFAAALITRTSASRGTPSGRRIPMPRWAATPPRSTPSLPLTTPIRISVRSSRCCATARLGNRLVRALMSPHESWSVPAAKGPRGLSESLVRGAGS